LGAPSRASFEAPVREFEDRAYGYAMALATDRERAEQIVMEAFAGVLATPRANGGIEPRLAAAIQRRASRPTRFGHSFWPIRRSRVAEPIPKVLPPTDLRVSHDLHQRILDAIEDRLYTSQPARSRLYALGAIVLLVAVGGGVQWERTRSQSLAAALPTVSDSAPARNASEVPLDGEFRISFGRRPSGTPALTLTPADGTRQPAHWDGNTLVVPYAGLRFGVHYDLVIRADYQSALHDTGHFQTSWGFYAEGYPRLVAETPADGAAGIPRVGQLSVDFTKRPKADPVITLQPAQGVLQPGQWSGTTWTVSYTGLQPLARYTGAMSLAAGGGAPPIHSTWSFTVEPGPPPSGVPVIWYSTTSLWQPPPQSGSYRLVALDWNGALAGTLYVSQPVRQNPDGSRLLFQDGTFVDAAGRVIGSPAPSYTGPVWADDGRHYCSIGIGLPTGGTGPTGFWLETALAGSPGRRVAFLGSPAGTDLTVLACSTSNDRAVVADQGMPGFLSIRVIQLSTGRLLYRHDYSPAPSLTVISSHDGRYVAEVSNNGGDGTVLRRTADGVVVARLGAVRVVAFSWDGMQVITAPPWGSSTSGAVDLLDWRRAAVLWHLTSAAGNNGQEVYALPRPNGSGFIVGVSSPSGYGDADGLLLVQPDGQARSIVTGSAFPATLPY
jgi:hypothetical protein